MSISKEDVKHIAHLARIEISEGEIEKFQGELGGILDYVEQLQEVDVEEVEPLRTISGARDVLREDEYTEDVDRRPEGQELIEQASDTKGGYVKTKAVFDDSPTA